MGRPKSAAEKAATKATKSGGVNNAAMATNNSGGGRVKRATAQKARKSFAVNSPTESDLRNAFNAAKTDPQKRKIIATAASITELQNLAKELQSKLPAPKKGAAPRRALPSRLGPAGIRAAQPGIAARSVKRLAGPGAVGVTNLGGRRVVFGNNRNAEAVAVRKVAISESAQAILSTSQLQSISGGDLEVIAAIYAAKMENWNVIDAKRKVPLSEQIISGQYTDPANNNVRRNLRLNLNRKTIVVKSRLDLLRLKRFGLGMAPPYGPPSNPVAFAGTAATNTLQPNNRHISAITEIASLLGQYNPNKQKLNWRRHVMNTEETRRARAAELAAANAENEANEGVVVKNATGKGIFFVEGDLEVEDVDAVEITTGPFDNTQKADEKSWIECKVGTGKYEVTPGEALQLIKAGWMTLLLWHQEQVRRHGSDLSKWKPPPKINLIFLSWFQGVHSQLTQNQMYNYIQDFTPISQDLQNRLNALARERFGMIDPKYGEPFTVVKATPRNLEALTGLKAQYITAYLVKKRNANIKRALRGRAKAASRGFELQLLPPGADPAAAVAQLRSLAPGIESGFEYSESARQARAQANWGGWMRAVLANPNNQGRLRNNGNYSREASRLITTKILAQFDILRSYFDLRMRDAAVWCARGYKYCNLTRRIRTAPKTNSPLEVLRKFRSAFSVLEFLRDYPTIDSFQNKIRNGSTVIHHALQYFYSIARPEAFYFADLTKIPVKAFPYLISEANKPEFSEWYAKLNLAPANLLVARNTKLKNNFNTRVGPVLTDPSRAGAVYVQFVTDHVQNVPNIRKLINNYVRSGAVFQNEGQKQMGPGIANFLSRI